MLRHVVQAAIGFGIVSGIDYLAGKDPWMFQNFVENASLVVFIGVFFMFVEAKEETNDIS
jgi:hypothetical protein